MPKEKINFNNLRIKYNSFDEFYNNSQVFECPEHSFELLPDINKAVEIIEKYKNKKIIIYGDYDCDGITATVTMLTGLKELGFNNVSYYIPRRKEGYGMNENSVQKIISENYDLVITVDTGIVSVDYVKQFKDAGVEVVITDHHEPLRTGELPPAGAVIDCKRSDSQYPFRDICGAEVAYKLIHALFAYENKEFPREEYLPLTILGTVADVMPLADENRLLVKEGLELVHKNPNEAYKQLFTAIGKFPMLETMKASDIAFYLGPLINASSRVGDFDFSINLLLNKDNKEICEECAKKLAEYNEERKKITEKIERGAHKAVNIFYPDIEENKVPMVIAGKDWNKGVVGIVASHIVETYGVPAIVMSVHDDKVSGSARSINEISMIKMLDYCKDYLVSYGGHTGAAGLSLNLKDINAFREKLKEYSHKYLSEDDYRVIHEVEAHLDLSEITLDNCLKVEAMEPFGEGNPEPRFYSEFCINSKRILGKNQDTLKIYAGNGSLNSVEGIMFQASDVLDKIKEGDKVRLLYTLGCNRFNGKETAQINIQAIEKI